MIQVHQKYFHASSIHMSSLYEEHPYDNYWRKRFVRFCDPVKTLVNKKQQKTFKQQHNIVIAEKLYYSGKYMFLAFLQSNIIF